MNTKGLNISLGETYVHTSLYIKFGAFGFKWDEDRSTHDPKNLPLLCRPLSPNVLVSESLRDLPK